MVINEIVNELSQNEFLKKVVEVVRFISKTGKIPLPKPIDSIPVITQPITTKIEFPKKNNLC